MNNIRILMSEFNSRMYAAKVRVNELENNSAGNIQSNAQRKKRKEQKILKNA